MKLTLTIIVSFILAMNIAYSQVFNWANQHDGPFIQSSGNGQGRDNEAIDVDLDGNVYAIGNFEYPFTIGTNNLTPSGIPNMPGVEVYMTKYNSSGALLWARKAEQLSGSAGMRATDIACDASGNFYITGVYSGPGSFSFNCTPVTLLQSDHLNMFVAKYDASGQCLWVRSANLSGSYPSLNATHIAVDNASNCYVAGEFYETFEIDGKQCTGTNDLFLAKFNSAGLCQWAVCGASNNGFLFSHCYGLAVDPSGDVFLASEFSAGTLLIPSVTFNGEVIPNSYGSGPNRTGFFVRCDGGNGTPRSHETYEVTPGNEGVKSSIGIDGNSNLYILGTHYIFKYDITTNIMFPRTWWTSSGYFYVEGMKTDLAGNSYVLGQIDGTANFISNTITGSGIFVIKLNDQGNYVWSVLAQSSVIPGDISADPLGGSAYIAGEFTDVVNFGTISLSGQTGNPELASSYVSKISGIKSINLKYRLEGIYPNLDNITVSLAKTSAPYDIVGSSTVMSQLDGNKFKAFLSFSNVPVNSYYIIVNHRNSIETWSVPVTINDGITDYDFTTSAGMAFGGNMKLVNSSPQVYAIYGGDVNQDGSVDLNDMTRIDNDSYNFATGYLSTDVTGDGFVDLHDMTIVDNNSYNFVHMHRPY